MGRFIRNPDFVSNDNPAAPWVNWVHNPKAPELTVNPNAPALDPWEKNQFEKNNTEAKGPWEVSAEDVMGYEPKTKATSKKKAASIPTNEIKVDFSATPTEKDFNPFKRDAAEVVEDKGGTDEGTPKTGDLNGDVPAAGVDTKNKIEEKAKKYAGKWSAYMEGMGLMVPGTEEAEAIRRMAETEQNAMYKEALSEATAAKQKNRQMGSQLASQREYQKYLNERKDLIAQRGKGQWIGHDDEWNAAMDNIDNAIRQYAGAAGFAQGRDPIALLQPRSPQAGSFTQEQRSEIVNAKRQNAVYKDVLDTLQSLSPEEWTAAQNQGYLSAVFDKMAEASVSGYFGTDKGAIADAEKIRMQFEVATPEDQAKLNNALSNFINLNTSLQRAGSNPNLTESVRRSLQDGVAAARNGNGIEALDILVRGNLLGSPNVPMDIGSAVSSLKSSYDQYIERFMQTGNVDRNTVMKLAMGNISKNNAIIRQFAQDYGRDAHGLVDVGQFTGLDKMAQWAQYKTGRQSQLQNWNGAGYTAPMSDDIDGHKPQAHHEENVTRFRGRH